MSDPIFVIHGVGNRSRKDFEERVAALQRAAQDRWSMVPVYWGDLGANDADVGITVPDADRAPGAFIVRDGEETPGSTGMEWLFGDATGGAVVRDDQLAPVVEGARSVVGTQDLLGSETRDSEPGADDLADAIRSEWSSTTWLPLISDPVVLGKIGAAVASALVDQSELPASGGAEVRDGEDTEIRFGLPNIGRFVKNRLQDIDEIVGAVMTSTLGRVNEQVRTKAGGGITKFFGDVLVYQRHREQIQARVWEAIRRYNDANGTALGTDAHPVQLAGHSLGGVIAFDVATNAKLRVPAKALLTFGSQSAFFHVCDPRHPPLNEFVRGSTVTLPAPLGCWVNLWEPLDVVAFVAASVFRLYDGTLPIDIPVPHLASSGLWTHSVYWELGELQDALRQTFD